MAKTKVSEWDSTPGNNTDIDSINIAEGCAPSGINNAIRELMSQVKDFQQGTYSDPFNGPVNGTIGATTASSGAFTTLTASSTATLNTLASSGATLTGGSINNMAIGGSTAAAGAFTTLAASGAVTLSGGTANGVAYLNGSKVLTSGSALTFDGSEVFKNSGGTIQYNDIRGSAAAGTRMSAGGTLGTDSFDLFQNSSYAAAWNRANTPIAFAVNNTEQMRLTSTGLGIGTSSPTTKLTVAGVGRFLSGTEGTQIGHNGTIGYIETSGNSATPLTFYIGGTERLRLDSSGNLGLGVTPSAWSTSTGTQALQIGSGGVSIYGTGSGWSSAAYMYLSNNAYYGSSAWRYLRSTSSAQYVQESGAHQWFTAPSGTAGNAISFTQAMTLDASGNLGVGTTSPSSYYANQIVAYKASRSGITVATDSTGIGDVAFAKGTTGNETYRGLVRYDHSSDYMAFWTGATERARIDSSGNLLVGTTSNPDNNRINVKQSAANSTIGVYAGTGGGLLNWYKNDNTYLASVTFSGSTVTYGTGSDYRLKENVQPISNALDKVAALRPVAFTWKDDGSYGESFIAHELQELYPTAVNGIKDAVDSEGNPRYQGVDTSKLVAVLTAAIQEQQAIINDLKARLDAANL